MSTSRPGVFGRNARATDRQSGDRVAAQRWEAAKARHAERHKAAGRWGQLQQQTLPRDKPEPQKP